MIRHCIWPHEDLRLEVVELQPILNEMPKFWNGLPCNHPAHRVEEWEQFHPRANCPPGGESMEVCLILLAQARVVSAMRGTCSREQLHRGSSSQSLNQRPEPADLGTGIRCSSVLEQRGIVPAGSCTTPANNTKHAFKQSLF